MSKVKRFNFYEIVKYFCLFFVCVVLANARVSGLSPFLYAFFFASIFVGLDEKIMGVFTLCSAILIDLSLPSLYVALTVVAVGVVVFYIHKFAKKRIKLLTIFLSFLISLVTYIYYNRVEVFDCIYYVILGLICLYVFITVLQVLLLRKNCFKLTLDESICFLFSIALLGVGIAPVKIVNFEIYRLILMFAIFLLLAVNSATLAYSVALSFALGVSLSCVSLIPIAEFAILMLISGVFSAPNKFKIVVLTLLTDAVIQYFFLCKSWQILYALLPIAVASIIYLILPKKLINNLSDLVYVKSTEISSRALINTTRRNIRKRMSELSNVFMDMKQIHLNMVKRELEKGELIAMLSREVMASCCKDCLDKNKCTRSLGFENKSNLETLIEIALTKGKVSLLDIPNSMSNRCAKINLLVNLINRLTDEYKQFKNMQADVNNVKILLADQMGAVSRLLLDLGEEIDTNVTFDMARENKIISRLLSNNIECREVLLYAEKNNDMSAILVIKAGGAPEPLVEKIVGEVCLTPMQITSIIPLEEGNYNSITLHKLNKFDCVFGLASCNKSGNDESGDCHSIIRLAGSKFLLALCDGMGSGKAAHKMSAMTLGLIENFYKVGFDNDIILESVNKLLAVNNQESYSTLDVCLIDLDKNLADFIKVGAPFGLIKRDSNIEFVEGGALPIGALDNITPATYKTTISTKDLIVLATDGITDAFETQESLADFVAHLATNNPQTIAESILNEALTRNEMTAKDDMTVLVARTYLKNK